MKIFRISTLGLFLLLLAAQPAIAFTKGACLKDEKKFCKDAPMADDGKKKCMKEHLEQLSDACKTNILEMVAKEAEKKKSGN